LTKFGRDVLPAIADVVASTTALQTQAKAFLEPTGSMIRVGVSPIVDLSKAVAVIAPYRLQNEHVEFVFKECFVDDLEARLTEGKIDIAIWPDVSASAANLSSASLFRDPWVFLPNASDGNFSGALPCPITDIAGQSFILTSGHCGLSQATQSMFERLGLDLVLYPGRALSYNAIEEWADLGLGAALMPASKVSRARKGTVIPVLSENHSAAMLNIVASWRAQPASGHLRSLVSYLAKTPPLSA
jgi:DNA-binding transcriptional LysR family regulator